MIQLSVSVAVKQPITTPVWRDHSNPFILPLKSLYSKPQRPAIGSDMLLRLNEKKQYKLGSPA